MLVSIPSVVSWQYSITEYSIQKALDTSTPYCTGYPFGRELVYANGKFHFITRPIYSGDGTRIIGYFNVTDSYDEANMSSHIKIWFPGDDLDPDYGAAWETIWYNEYEDELWIFTTSYDYGNYNDFSDPYLIKYYFSNNTWSDAVLWKDAPVVNGYKRMVGFNYYPEPVTLANGDTRLVMPVSLKYYGIGSGDEFLCECAVYYSDDEGVNWTLSDIVPDKPYSVIDIEENSVVQLPNGSLCMNFRLADRSVSQAYFMWRTFSHDYGETWTTPEGVYDVTIDVSKTLLRKVDLFGMPVYVFYAHNRPEGITVQGWSDDDRRSNLSLWFSADGLNWDGPNCIYDDARPSGFGQGKVAEGLIDGERAAYGSFIEHNNSLYLSAYSTNLAGGTNIDRFNIFRVNISINGTITNESIDDYETDVDVMTSNFSAMFLDFQGNTFNYSIELNTGDTQNENNVANGTKSLPFTYLIGNHLYIVYTNSSNAFFNRTYHFTTEPQPTLYKINNKGNGGVTVDSKRNLTWVSVENANRYQLQISNDASFTNIFYDQSNINATNYASEYYNEVGDFVNFNITNIYDEGALIDNAHYYRVRAYVGD